MSKNETTQKVFLAEAKNRFNTLQNIFTQWHDNNPLDDSMLDTMIEAWDTVTQALYVNMDIIKAQDTMDKMLEIIILEELLMNGPNTPIHTQLDTINNHA